MRINGYEWTIRMVDRKEINNDDGECNPNKFTISIADDLKGLARITTFVHELVHAVLNTQGRYYQKQFDLEDVCEFIAWSYLEINKCVEQFMREIGV